MKKSTMRKLIFILIVCQLIISCKLKDKGNLADNRGPDHDKPELLVLAKKDTLNIFEILEMQINPKQAMPGSETEQITTKTIVRYNDSNKDTIFATIKSSGIIHPPSIPNPPPDEPFERIEQYKFYKLNEAWKAEEIEIR